MIIPMTKKDAYIAKTSKRFRISLVCERPVPFVIMTSVESMVLVEWAVPARRPEREETSCFYFDTKYKFIY